MDLISIVVAVYNAEKTLRKCIDSLLAQTYKNYEIILVNDCSVDSSLSICQEYVKNNPQIKVISNEKNCGVSVTRNNGIEKSEGKYICFVDSDDYVEINYLEVLYETYIKYNTVPVCGFTYYDEVDKMPPKVYDWSEGDSLVSLEKVFQLNDELYLTALWNKLFDNEVIKKHNIRFEENLSMGEDLRFSLDYFEKNGTDSVYVLTAPLYNYIRLSENSLMGNFGLNGIEDAIENLNRMRKIAEKFSEVSEEEFNTRIENIKNSYIYFINKTKRFSNKEKLENIRKLRAEYSKTDFAKDQFLLLKEKVYKLLHR